MQCLGGAGVEFAEEKFRFAEVSSSVADVLLPHNRRHLARSDNKQLHGGQFSFELFFSLFLCLLV